MASSQSQRAQQPRKPRARFAPEYEVLLRQLIDARKAAGVTQEEVGRRLGKTQSHVSMCENREREVSIIDLWKWCGALGISMTDFVHQFEEALSYPDSAKKTRP